MLVARFRLAAPLSSLGVIEASMEGTTERGRAEGRRAMGKIFDSDRRSRQSTSKTSTLYDATREAAERLEAFLACRVREMGEIRASRYGLFGSAELAPTLIRSRRNAKGSGS